MAKAGTSAPPATASPKRPIWAGPLVTGFCFALAYGATQRLLGLNVGELIRFGNGFDVQVFPGTSLDSLRLRFGEAEAEIRADLELQELQRQQREQAKRQAEEAKRLEAELRQADQLEPLPEQPLDGPPAAPALPDGAPTAPRPAALSAMTQPQTLLQAAINRLSARLGSGLADAAAELAVLAQDAPERLRQEWDLFREEVELEAERLERGDAPVEDGLVVDGPGEGGLSTDGVPEAQAADPQRQIDALRAQVARLTRRLEDQP